MLIAEVNYAKDPPRYDAGMEEMGDRIRTLRNSRSLTQEQLGKIVGVTGAAIAQWESGATKGIKPEHFLRFCSHFGVDPYWVVFGSNGHPNDPRGRRSVPVP